MQLWLQLALFTVIQYVKERFIFVAMQGNQLCMAVGRPLEAFT